MTEAWKSTGESALMLVSARLRHMATTHWGQRRYLNMNLLKILHVRRAVAALQKEACAAGVQSV